MVAGSEAQPTARDAAGTGDAKAEQSSALLPAALVERLACASCFPDAASLESVDGVLICSRCRATHPIARNRCSGIPWLYPDPGLAHIGWSARLKGFLRDNTTEYNRLNRARSRIATGSLARRRILASMKALRAHRQQTLELLEPVWLDGNDLETPTTALLNDRVPRNLALSSYASNVFRDWAWENGENEALLESVTELLETADGGASRFVLTLGAGACRLPYDLHRRYRPTLSVAMDLNPLLILIGSRIVQGETLSMYEFPLAPLPGAESGVLNRCRAPQRLTPAGSDEFCCVLGDATCAPFAPASFDTVVTPWLIDVLAEDPQAFAPRINRLLTPDGLWINTGSMVFESDDPGRRYTEAEVHQIVEQSGFEIVAQDHRSVPYLQSPNSANGRVEHVSGFAARKCREVATPNPPSLLPDWLVDTDRPVPQLQEFTLSSSTYLLNAQVLAAIDGKRSIRAIARLVSREYNLSLDECLLVLQRILISAAPESSARD